MTERKGTLLLKHSQIVVHWTDGRTESFRLGESTRIGRGRDRNDVAVPDLFQSVSRQHLEIRREKTGYRLIDLGSRNGVLVNGIYAKDTYLRDGDEIRIGQDDQGQQIRIEFQLGSEAMLSELVSEEFATISPASGLASESPVNMPHFKIRWQNGSINYFPIEKDRIIIGRGPGADLRVPETLRFVSSQQAEILRKEAGFVIRDLNSANGTLLNNQLLQPDREYPLGHESIIRLGDEEYGVSVSFIFFHPAEQTVAVEGFLQTAPPTQIAKAKHILIGRLSNCDLVLDNPEVSRRHAMIRQVGEGYLLEDLDSSNGTFVNDHQVKQIELHDGDVIRISKFLLLFQGGQLVPYQSTGMRLDATGLSVDIQTKNGKQRVLDQVNLSVLPREFVVLVGGGGLGTSTLLGALAGIQRGDGKVQLNGYDLHRHYESLQSQLGYVPRSDILHPGLTVENTLDHAARLRLPSNLSPDERMIRIDTVLETVSINTDAIRKARISTLTDEQRKRITIAVELLNDPKLVLLDEAASVFDPGLEKKLFYTLRRMADEGRTIILTAHATDNIMQADQVAVLSEGKLVYFGPPAEAKEFFEVEEFADIYERIDRKSDEWRGVFQEKKPEQYRKYIQERQKTAAAMPKRALPGTSFSIADFFSQLLVLSRRAWDVAKSDRLTLLLLFLLLPVTGILQLIISKPDILTGNLAILADPIAAAITMTGSYMPFAYTNAFLLLMGLEAVAAGMFLPLNQLIKEHPIFMRERMMHVREASYLLSKTLVYGCFAFVQVFLYLFILSLGVDFPARGLYFSGPIEIFITLFLTMAAGVSLGLLISAMSKSAEMAAYILVAILFLQLFFSGAGFDLRGNKFEPLSYLSPARWSVTALGTTIDMQKITESTILCNNSPENAGNMVCFNHADAKNELHLNYDDGQLTNSWTMLAGMALLLLAGTWFLLRRDHPPKS